MHLLVVEDDPTVRRMLQLVLGDLGDVEAVSDREAAQEAVERQRPDVVILDVMLHGLSGLALLSHWRADPAYEDLPVILLTALDDSMERKAGTAAGADAYLTKPFAPEDLVAVIQDLTLGGNRAERGLVGSASRR